MGRTFLAAHIAAGSLLLCCGHLDSLGSTQLAWSSGGDDSASEGDLGSSGASLSTSALSTEAFRDLEDWLAAVNFIVPDDAIPPIQTHFSVLLIGDVSVEVHIHGLDCNGLRIGVLDSRPNQGGLEVGLEKVSINCKATVDYHSSLGLGGTAQARVHTQDAVASVRMLLSSSDTVEPKVPDAVDFDGCSSHLDLQLSIDSGTVWTELTKYIPGLVTRLGKDASEALDAFVCDTALEGARSSLGGGLRRGHDLAHELMAAAGPAPPSWDEDLVALQHVPLAKWFGLLDKQLRAFPGIYNAVAERILPDGRWPAIGDSNWAMRDQICILGGDQDTDCVIAKSLHVDPPADLRIEVRSADLFANFSDIEPLEPHNATVTSRANLSMALAHATMNFTFNGWAGGAEAKGLNALIGLDLGFKALTANGSIFVGLDRATFETVPSYHYLPFQCVAPSFRSLGLTDLALDFDIEHTSLSVIQGTQSAVLIQAAALVSNALAMVRHYDDAMVAVLNGFLRGNVTDIATRHVNEWASDLRSKQCPEPMAQETDGGRKLPLVNPPLADTFLWIALTLVASAGLCAVVHFFRKCIRNRSQEDLRTQMLPGNGKSLSAQTPWLLSLTMVLTIFACIFFFLGSNFLLMADTFLTLENGAGLWGEPESSVRLMQVMVYSMLFSVKALREEGGLSEFLSYLLLFFSGIFPYVKLLAMLVCWVMPATTTLRKWQRGCVLLFLDLVGKFSLVDVFVIQFISASMHTVIDVSRPNSEGVLPAGPLSLVLRTNQEDGFTAFVLATVVSLIIGHICLYFHEREPAVKEMHSTNALPELTRGLADNSSPCDIYRAAPGRRRWYVAPVLLLTLALVNCGMLAPAFTVKLISPLGQFSEASYSFLSFGKHLPELSEEPNSFTTRFAQGTFLFFGIISINAHLVLLLVTWYGRSTFRRLAKANILGHMLFAYAALDVALLSMVLTMLEMTTSNFVTLNDSQREILSHLSGRSIETNQGLRVDVAFGPGVWLLFAGVLLHWPIGREISVCLDRVVHSKEQWAASQLPLSTGTSVVSGYNSPFSERYVLGKDATKDGARAAAASVCEGGPKTS